MSIVEEYIYRLHFSGSRYPPLFFYWGTTQNITFKICHRQSKIIVFSIGDFGGRNFAGGRRGATPEPDSNYAKCQYGKNIDAEYIVQIMLGS